MLKIDNQGFVLGHFCSYAINSRRESLKNFIRALNRLEAGGRSYLLDRVKLSIPNDLTLAFIVWDIA